jgi:hypothetical protein
MTRHANLYDLRRWRKNRTLLLATGTVFLVITVAAALLRPNQNVGPLYSVVGSMAFAIAAALWVRQRWSYLGVDGDQLLVRAVSVRQRVPLSEIGRVRVSTLRAIFNSPQRRRLIGRRAPLDTSAVVVRIDDATTLLRLRRILGRRCVVERDLVVPVEDPEGLAGEIEAARPLRVQAVHARRGRRRR